MATRSSIRTSALNLLANHSMLTSTNMNDLITANHQQILNDFGWTRRKVETILNTTGTYSTGTVSGSSGSTSITGSSTVWTSGFVDRYIRIGDNTFYHRITAVGSNTSLTIEGTDGLPAAVAAGTSYTIFRHIYDLPNNFGRILSVATDVGLVETTHQFLDRLDPYRSGTASRPDRFCIVGVDSPEASSGNYQIEFYPVPSSASTVRIFYLRTNDLDEDTDEPLYRSDVLVYRIAESGAHFLYARTGDKSWLDLADRYHDRYKESLEGALNDDLAKSSPVTHIKDALLETTHGDDWYINRDAGGRFIP